MRRDARAVIAGVDRHAVATVVPQLFVERHADALRGAALHLARRGQRIHDAAAVVRGHVLDDADAADVDVHVDGDEMRREAHTRHVRQGRVGRRGRHEHVGAFRPSFVRNLPFEILRRFDHRVAGEVGRPAA